MRTWTDAGMKAEKVRMFMNVNDFFLIPHYSFTTIKKGELRDEEFTQSKEDIPYRVNASGRQKSISKHL